MGYNFQGGRPYTVKKTISLLFLHSFYHIEIEKGFPIGSIVEIKQLNFLKQCGKDDFKVERTTLEYRNDDIMRIGRHYAKRTTYLLLQRCENIIAIIAR
jgi:hypothetical protein